MRKLIAASAAGAALVLALPTSALAFKEVDPAPAATVEVFVDNPDFRSRVVVNVVFQPPDGSDRVFVAPDTPDVPTGTVDINFTPPDSGDSG